MKSSVNDTLAKVRLVTAVHAVLRAHIQAGDTVVDATLGNGYDTLALAEWVGSNGKVIGFDIQPQAIETTKNRLRAAGLLARIQLQLSCHSRMAEIINRPVAAVVFNLGWLPGADHSVVTLNASTLAALDASWGLLQENGLISVVAYRGHPGGADEYTAVGEWMRKKQDEGNSLKISPGSPEKAASPVWFLLKYRRQNDADGASGHERLAD